MKVFIPVGDEILDHPELLYLLVPYQAGVALASPAGTDTAQSRCSTKRSPGANSSSEALPELSSNTY